MSKAGADKAAPQAPTGGGRGKKDEPVVVPPDENQLRHAAIVSSTFANLELLTTKETLTQYSGLYQAAKEDLGRVNNEMVERDRDHMKVVDHLRSQNRDTTEKMKTQKSVLEERIDQMRTDFQHEKDDLNAMLREKDAIIAKLNVTIDQQQADLDSLNAFKRERHDIHTEISNYKQRQAEIALEHEQEMSKVKFAALEERVRLKTEERNMRERFETEVSTQAAAMLGVRTREIHDENAQLIEDKVLQQDEIDRLTKENRNLKAKSDEQRRELELSKGAEEGYSVRCAKQSIEIKELKKQIQILEQSLAKTIETYDAQLQGISDVSTGTVSKLQTERDAAYRNAEGRQKELLKLRSVAKQVVQQRGELEMFFHEALAFVKKELLAERAEANRQLQIQAQHEQLLRIKAAPSPSSTPQKSTTRSQLHQFLPKESLAQSPSNTARGAHPKPLKAATRGGGGAAAETAPTDFDIVGSNTNHSIPQPPSSAPTSTTSTSVPTLPAIGRSNSNASQSSSVSSRAVPAASSMASPTALRSQRANAPLAAVAQSYSGGLGYMAHTANTVGRDQHAINAHHQQQAQQLQQAQAAGADGFIDIADLSWADKERVLRILFAKINSKEQQQAEGGGRQQLPAPPMPSIEDNPANRDGPILSQQSPAASAKERRYLRDANSTTFFTQ